MTNTNNSVFEGKINGLYYKVKGEGDPIIFLHGIGGTHKMFQPQVEELSKYFKTISVDLKGNGKSESVATKKYLQVHIESILDLLNHLNIEKAIFVGLSYGGIVTQSFAIEHPEKVQKMILLDSYAQMFPKTFKEVLLTFFGAFMTLAAWLPVKLVSMMFSPYKKWNLAYEELVFNMNHWRAKDVTLQLLEVFGKDMLKDIETLEIPTLVIVGDALQPVVRKSEEIAEHIPRSELLIVKNSLDPTNLCQPEIVNQALFQFVSTKSKSVST